VSAAGRDPASAARPSPQGDPPLLVLAPLPEEAAGILARLRKRAPIAVAGVRRAWRGELAGRPTVLGIVGDGPVASARGAERLLSRAGQGEDGARVATVVCGVAGALDPELVPGDIVVAEVVIDEASGAKAVPLDAGAAARAIPGAGFGALLTARAIAARPEDRQALRGRWPPAVAVDLETFPIARSLESAGVRWLALRAIADGVADVLPPYLERARGPDGAIRRAAVLGHALAAPSSIATLLRMRSRVARCSAALAAAVERVAAAGWPTPVVPGSGRRAGHGLGFRE
jgi:adenosylhomocysteine nucleosidase